MPSGRTGRLASLKLALLLITTVVLLLAVNVHPPYAAGAASSLTVDSQANGAALNGMYIALETGGSVVSSGFTPVTFSVTPGQTYQVLADDYGPYSFAQWSTGTAVDPIAITATSASLSLTANYATATGGGGKSSLTVDAQVNGNDLSGMYIALEGDGSVVATGFTPVTFSLASGQTYQVFADNYGPYSFSQWNGGSTSNPLTVTETSAGSDLTAVYSTTGGSGGGSSSLLVSAQADGNDLNGMYVALEQSGSVVATGFTPVAFSLTPGETYQVVVDDYGQYTFSTWSSGGGTANPTTLSSGVAGQTLSLTATYTTGTTTMTKSNLGIIIPLYGNVTSTWQSVINYHKQFASVPMMMVINPHDGPGLAYNSTLNSWVSMLQSDGIPVLGYVTTAYTALPLSQVETQVNDYVSWYGIHSIFIDDVENVHGYEQYYTTLSNYAHSNGISFVLGNPGTNVTASYIGIFDNIGTYENSGAPAVSLIQRYTMGLPAIGFSFIAYNAPLQSQAYYDAMAQYVSWVYLTDNPNTWTSLPSYISQEMTELAAT